ncbi:MAG: SCP2 sterol-binding domain-containing protein [Actinomycetota bacterium]|nr:SCP2 sterol-binding domain-containing protein [Actinomycetota bacterium]
MANEDMGLSPDAVSPEEFAQLVAAAENDQQITDVIHAVGTDKTLDRIFQGFEDRFLPEKAKDVDAEVLFVIDDEGTEHNYAVTIRSGTCSTTSGTVDNPKTTLKTDLVSFVKLITGQADGIQLFMGGSLRVSGDLMFAQRIMTFFDRPATS